MPLKRAQLKIFEASAKVFRTDRKTQTYLYSHAGLDVWTVRMLEQRSLLTMPSRLSRYAYWNTTSRIVPVPVENGAAGAIES
jgi:hypothetical protein